MFLICMRIICTDGTRPVSVRLTLVDRPGTIDSDPMNPAILHFVSSNSATGSLKLQES